MVESLVRSKEEHQSCSRLNVKLFTPFELVVIPGLSRISEAIQLFLRLAMSFADPFSSRFEVFGREHKHTVDGINHQALEKLKRLLDVGEGGDGRVVLLRAPRAGFGKTSVLQRLAGEFKESHQFVRVNLVGGRTIDAAHVLEYVLQALCEVLPGSSTLTKLDHLARRILALGLEPLVSSGEVPCQDREGALLALREQPTETFDFHHDRAVTAHWTKSNFEILGPRLAAELARVSGASLREASYWVELLFRFATTAPDNVERARLLFETVFRSDLQNQSESAAEERLHGLCCLFGTVTNLVLIVDDTEGLSTSPSDALALASFLTNLSQCCPGTLVLLSVNDDIWESAFVPLLPGGLADRLTEYDVRLHPLNDHEARAMVTERAGNRAAEVFEKMDWGSGDLYARRVLKAASEAWEQLEHDTSSPLEVVDEPGEGHATLSDEDEDLLDDLSDLEALQGEEIEDDVRPSPEGEPSTLVEDHTHPEETSKESAVIDQVTAADSIESPSSISQGAKEPKVEVEVFAKAEDLDGSTLSAGGELEAAGAEAGEEREDADESSGEVAAEERLKPAKLQSEEGAPSRESQEVAPIAPEWGNAAPVSRDSEGPDLGAEALSETEGSGSDRSTPAASPFSPGTPAPGTIPSPEENSTVASGEGASTPGGAPEAAPTEANPFRAANNGVLKSLFAREDRASDPESKEPIASRGEGNPFLAEKPAHASAEGDKLPTGNGSPKVEAPGEEHPFVATGTPRPGDENPFTGTFSERLASFSDEKGEGSSIEEPSSEITPNAIESQPAADLPKDPPLSLSSERAAFAPSLESSFPPSSLKVDAKEFASPPPLDLNPSTPPALDPELLCHVSEDLSAPLQGDHSSPPFGSATGNDSPPNPLEASEDEEFAEPASPFSSPSRGAAGIEKILGEGSSLFAPLHPAGEDPLDPGPLKPLLESESVEESRTESAPSTFTAGAPPAAPLTEADTPFAAGSPPPPTEVSSSEPPPLNPIASHPDESPFKPGFSSAFTPLGPPPATEGTESTAALGENAFTAINSQTAPSASPEVFGPPVGVHPPDSTLMPGEKKSAASSADPPEPAVSSNGADEPFITKENEPTAPQAPEVPAPATSWTDPVDTPFKPVALAPNDDPASSPFAKGEPVALTQRTELPPRMEIEAPGSDSPLDGLGSPFVAGPPPSLQGIPVSPPAAPADGGKTTFEAGESSPFASVGGPPTERPVSLARIDPAPPEPAIPPPISVISGGDSANQDKVDELLRQFKERYGRK